MDWPFIFDLALIAAGAACFVVVLIFLATGRIARLRESKLISVLGFLTLGLAVIALVT